jgi:hypothetical protein
MTRYIDAEKLNKKLQYIFKTYGVSAVIRNKINNALSASTADVEEVVRCKDCIYYQANCCFNRQWDFESSTEIPLVRENDFCSYGERKPQKEG